MSFQHEDLRIKPRAGHVMLSNLKFTLFLLPFFLLFLYWLESDPSLYWVFPCLFIFVNTPMRAYHARKLCIRTRKGRIWVDPYASKSVEIMDLEIQDPPTRYFWRHLFGKPGLIVHRKGRTQFHVSRHIFAPDQIEEMNTYLREYQEAVRAARSLQPGGEHV